MLGGSHCQTTDLGVRFVMDLSEVSDRMYLKASSEGLAEAS